VSGILSENSLKGVRVERRTPDEAFAKTPFKIEYVAFNSKRFFPSYSLRITEAGAKALTEPYVVKLKAGERATMEGSYVAARRGRFVFREVDVVTRYPFGLFEKTALLKLKDEIVVFPAPRPVEDPSTKGAERGVEESALIKGEGVGLISLREYVEGDNPRKISWKVTARTGKIMVRETEAQDMPMMALVLDTTGYRPDATRIASKTRSPNAPESHKVLIRKATSSDC